MTSASYTRGKYLTASPPFKDFYIRSRRGEQLRGKQVTNVVFVASLLIRTGTAEDATAKWQIGHAAVQIQF